MPQRNVNVTAASVLPTAQIIVLALAAGVFLFGVVVLFLRGGLMPFDPNAILSLTMAGVAVMATLGRFLVPPLVVRQGCQQILAAQDSTTGSPRDSDHDPVLTGKLAPIFLTRLIVGCALLEGGAFACLVAFLLEGQVYTLVLAILLMFGILLAFPTRSSLDDWLQRQRRYLDEQRNFHRRR